MNLCVDVRVVPPTQHISSQAESSVSAPPASQEIKQRVNLGGWRRRVVVLVVVEEEAEGGVSELPDTHVHHVSSGCLREVELQNSQRLTTRTNAHSDEHTHGVTVLHPSRAANPPAAPQPSDSFVRASRRGGKEWHCGIESSRRTLC